MFIAHVLCAIVAIYPNPPILTSRVPNSNSGSLLLEVDSLGHQLQGGDSSYFVSPISMLASNYTILTALQSSDTEGSNSLGWATPYGNFAAQGQTSIVSGSGDLPHVKRLPLPIFASVVLLAGSILCCICLCTRYRSRPVQPPPLDADDIQAQKVIMGVTLYKWADVEHMMLPNKDAEWSLSVPLRSHQIVRFEAHVLAGAASILSPLTNRRCVSCSLLARRTSNFPPLFKVSDSIDLFVKPTGASASVRIAADTVKLCSIVNNWYFQSGTFGTIKMPDKWREKALRENPRLSIYSSLEFHECLLQVGCLVTVVGELHRDEEGMLQMKPCHALPKAEESPIADSSRDSPVTDTENTKVDESPSSLVTDTVKAEDKSQSSFEDEKLAITRQCVLVSDGDAGFWVWG